MWQHVQPELDVLDTAMTPFADRYGCWGLLDLWRSGGRSLPPSCASLARSVLVVPGARRRSRARSSTRTTSCCPSGRPWCLSGRTSRCVRRPRRGRALLHLNPPDEPMAPIPAAVYNVAAALLAAEQSEPVGDPSARIHLGGGRWLTVKASAHSGTTSPCPSSRAPRPSGRTCSPGCMHFPRARPRYSLSSGRGWTRARSPRRWCCPSTR